MQYTKHLRTINADIKEFITNSNYLPKDEVGRQVIKERITRLYNQLTNPNTHKENIKSMYKLIAAYAIMGLMGEIEHRVTEEQ